MTTEKFKSKLFKALTGALMGTILMTGSAYALTFYEVVEPDPFSDGNCKGQALGSWGSYLEGSPAQWDGLHGPAVTGKIFFFCDSGYAGFF